MASRFACGFATASFFPAASIAGGDAACAAQCPDAPTALYTMPADRIEDAVSLSGKPYTQLPVAKRYQTSFESTCTCHRDTVASRPKDILNDPTLRKGDVVMTADGFRVYEGGGYGASRERDFVSLSRAGLPKDERATLVAMERSGAGSPPRPRPHWWWPGQEVMSPSTTASRRRRIDRRNQSEPLKRIVMRPRNEPPGGGGACTASIIAFTRASSEALPEDFVIEWLAMRPLEPTVKATPTLPLALSPEESLCRAISA